MQYIKKAIKFSLLIIMLIQIIFGLTWILQNITSIPIFGDTNEYLNLSQTLSPDEYRPILYPLILRFFTFLEKTSHIPYQILLYLIQAIVSLLSIIYCVYTIMNIFSKKPHSKWLIVFISMYIWTIPMITFMNFSVLTDSFANSMLIICLTDAIVLLTSSKYPIRIYFSIAVTLILQSLLRADRLYSSILMLVIILIIRLVTQKTNRKQCFIIFLSIFICCTIIVKGINNLTQTPGINGRISTNFEFVLLDRIVWPNMSANYEFFSEEIKSVISIDEAKTFDSHNNNVMYQMAPLLEERVGHEKACEYYREMAQVVFTHQTKKVLYNISEDILAMLFTPYSSLLNTKGLCSKGDSWNITCMSGTSPKTTVYYNLYYLYSFLYLSIIAFIKIIFSSVNKHSKYIQKSVKTFIPFIVMSIILTLWFSIGDGAPPNDRYALIIYITWTLFAITINLHTFNAQRSNYDI